MVVESDPLSKLLAKGGLRIVQASQHTVASVEVGLQVLVVLKDLVELSAGMLSSLIRIPEITF